MINLKATNGKPCTEDQVNWMIETAIKAAAMPTNHGQAHCVMGNTLINVYTTYDGSIEVEVTERKRYAVIKPTEEAQAKYNTIEAQIEEAQRTMAIEGATCSL